MLSLSWFSTMILVTYTKNNLCSHSGEMQSVHLTVEKLFFSWSVHFIVSLVWTGLGKIMFFCQTQMLLYSITQVIENSFKNFIMCFLVNQMTVVWNISCFPFCYWCCNSKLSGRLSVFECLQQLQLSINTNFTLRIFAQLNKLINKNYVHAGSSGPTHQNY